jgi:hypothetical protein
VRAFQEKARRGLRLVDGVAFTFFVSFRHIPLVLSILSNSYRSAAAMLPLAADILKSLYGCLYFG